MTPRHRHIASALVVIGSALVAIVALPIGFSTLHFRFFSPKTLIDPTAVGLYPRPKIINVLGLTTSDYTSPVSWFPSAPIDPAATPSSRVRYYTLTIPSLSLHDIPVEISGSDLTKNAIQFPNTALPSQVGNTVILGHSSLPGLYKKGSPQVIFNPLPNIKIGAEVVITEYDASGAGIVAHRIREK